ncbi:aldo/keto reductase [Clostridium folliculivorans]|uniref:Glyoxal reductase n=1 Tax=Clostridium folliculivorans TaxID=2886038 RepID=A0A9W5Y097_9CLOT|nr:aldo/keto reductase [Clostridium folliculivorans]GKU24191.1 glyoxal reductase [Clostridium folliculivorans]GKU30296.1 glyoxal reductase [Clostridium folliculivorans]
MNLANKEIEAVNGVKIPQVGFGVYKITKIEDFETAVGEAIRIGYRHFDTAKIYGNEKDLGIEIQKSNIPREEFFITSKVWNTELGYEATKKAFEKTCKNLNIEYIDMYLIHFAAPGYIEAWRAMEELYLEGKIKVIGVANFEIQHLERLMKHSKITPMINQIETHPEFPQDELHNYLVKHKILHEAWAPLGQGNKDLFKNTVLKEIASNHEKTVAQVILRWHIQRGIIIIPKSSNPKRIKENIQLFDFELSSEEMKKISKLNTGKRYSHSPTGYMVNPLYNKLMKMFIK